MTKTGILENKLLKNISIYPNPITDILNIDIPKNINVKSINIYSIDGKIIEKNMYSFKSEQLNISKLATGSYVLNIETDKGDFSQIIIKN
jgi:hypothetical protein